MPHQSASSAQDDDNSPLTLSAETLAAMHDLNIGMNMHIESSSDEEEEEQADAAAEANAVPFDYKAYYAKKNNGDANTTKTKKKLDRVALVALDDVYARDCVLAAFARRPNWKVNFAENAYDVVGQNIAGGVRFIWGEYESIDWESDAFRDENVVVSAYLNRRGLIRKGLIANTLNKWAVKYPDSLLASCTPETLVIESMDEAGIDDAILKVAERVESASHWWILKPSFTNQADGIQVVRSLSELRDALVNASELHRAAGFVLQKYVDNPLLLLPGGRKFHIRVLCVAVGDLAVYVFPDLLALFATNPYADAEHTDLYAHLTNTCFQTKDGGVSGAVDNSDFMFLWSEMVSEILASGAASTLEEAQQRVDAISAQVKKIIGEVFAAGKSELTFQPRRNCFETFGMDLMVDVDWNVWFLEANAEPDLSMAGSRLQHVIEGFVEDVLALTVDVDPRFTDVDSESHCFPLEEQLRNLGFVHMFLQQ